MPCLLDFSRNVVRLLACALPDDGSLFVSLKEMCFPRVDRNELVAMLPKAYLYLKHQFHAR